MSESIITDGTRIGPVFHEDLINRRNDLQAAIGRAKRGDINTGLVHAANRAVRLLDDLLNRVPQVEDS